MTLEIIILYILLGYSIISVWIFIKLFNVISTFKTSYELRRRYFHRRIRKNESDIEYYMKRREQRFTKDLENFNDIRKKLYGNIDINIEDANIEMRDSVSGDDSNVDNKTIIDE